MELFQHSSNVSTNDSTVTAAMNYLNMTQFPFRSHNESKVFTPPTSDNESSTTTTTVIPLVGGWGWGDNPQTMPGMPGTFGPPPGGHWGAPASQRPTLGLHGFLEDFNTVSSLVLFLNIILG